MSIRRKDNEITDPSQVEAILQDAKVCRIGLSEGGMPYIVPVCFGFAEGCLYFHSARTREKIEVLRKNPRVCFEVDIPGILTGTGPSVPGDAVPKRCRVRDSGTAQSAKEKRPGLACIISHYANAFPVFPDEAIQEVAVIKARISSMTGKQSH
jgi:hypothetical protein